jgi:hypothetical protein
MGQAGRRRVIARFQLENQISAFDELYKAVLGGQPVGLGAVRGEATGVPA